MFSTLFLLSHGQETPSGDWGAKEGIRWLCRPGFRLSNRGADLVEEKHRFVCRQQKFVPTTAGEKFHLALRLTQVGFKAQWEFGAAYP